MSHIDEGRLHAWLDRDRSGMTEAEYTLIGSHLAKCAECAALLQEERRIRDRSMAILGQARPAAVTLPSFDALAARAPAAPRALPTRRPVVAMAWAASLLAALGLGWLASSMLDRGPQLALQTEEATTRATAAESAPSAPLTTSAAPDAAASVTLPKAGITTGPEITPSPVMTAQPSVSGDLGGIGAVAGVAEVREENAPQSPPAALDEVVVVGYGGGAPSAPAGARITAERAGIESLSIAQTRAAAAPAAPPSAPAPPPPTAITAFVAGGPLTAWEVVTRDEAQRRLGVPLITHPSLPIVSFQAAPVGGEPAVRVTHALPGGQLLALSMRRALPGVQIATAAFGSVSVLRPPLALVATAPLSADSIAALLAQTR